MTVPRCLVVFMVCTDIVIAIAYAINKQPGLAWRRLCKVLLRNDYWCKGLGQTQPKSDAYIKFKEIQKLKGKKLRGHSEKQENINIQQLKIEGII
jgi:hypothetical protein